MKSNTIKAKQMLIAFLILLGISALLTIGYAIYTSGYEKTEAVVASIESKTTGKRHKKSYYEIIEYVYDGETYTVNRDISSATSSHEGDKVTIKVNPKKPSAVFDTSIWNYLLIADGMFFVFSVLLGVKVKNEKKA